MLVRNAHAGGNHGKEVIEWGLSCCPSFILLVSPAAAGQRVWRLGVFSPGDWAESSVPLVMVPEAAAFGADHDRWA